jgi:Ice-binding-like
MRPNRTTLLLPLAPAVKRRQRSGLRRCATRTSVTGATVLTAVLLSTAFPGVASATTPVQLNTAAPFAVLAGTAVTDVPTSAITGDVGLSPAAGSNYAGLTQAEVTGTIYAADATGPAGAVDNPGLLTQAKNDLTTAFVSAAGEVPTTTYVTGDNQLGGKTLTPGVYAFGHATTANLTAASPLVLNGNGDPGALFVFKASSDLVTASNSVVQLENGAQACNVYWVVGSSATLATSSTFVGTLMALTSATLATGATVQGRILARNGAVTLDANVITTPPTCAATTTPATTTATTATTAPGSPSTTAPTSGFTGSGGSAAGATPGAAIATSATVVPTGFPHTGMGGAARGPSADLIGLGILSLAAAAGVTGLIARRRSEASES